MTQERPPIAQLLLSLVPLFALIGMLWFNVKFVFGDSALDGSNQVILMVAALIAGVLGVLNGTSSERIFDKIANNLRDTAKATFILILIGGLAGTWLVSGIVPAMIYYGLDLLSATFFLPAAVVICAVVSISTGSSWSTTATVGIAMMGIGKAMGIPDAIIAGAVISGAYFGDKLSPMSDTTNLAPAMAGTDLFTHIRYMLYTTVPSILIALLLFTFIGLNYAGNQIDANQIQELQTLIDARFEINGWLFLIPVGVIALIIRKVDALTALALGVLGGLLMAVIFQAPLLRELGSGPYALYQAGVQSIYGEVVISSENPILSDLLSSGGMSGMLGTVWLMLSAMAFGGAMEATGFLDTLTLYIVAAARGTASLIAATLAASGLINITASDQYLALVVPGRMFKDVYAQRKLAPQNLSRTLEDGGTVTSVLVPWNTCGAYQSGVLGVATGDYFIYAFFNLLSPLMSLIYAIFGIKIAPLEEGPTTEDEPVA